MPETNINLRNLKKCAFCIHWNDPTNSAIYPISPTTGIWHYDGAVKKLCMLKGSQRKGFEGCNSFEMKL